MSTIQLNEIAHARSGDKGNHANIGVIAFTEAGYDYIGQYLTEARMAELLLPFRPRSVQRYALPGIRAYNFVATEILGGGASRSLRIDSQGKTLAQAVLQMEIPAPADVEAMRK